MLWSKAFIATSKESAETTESISHQLILRASLMRMLMAGVYSYLPLGLRVLNNIESIIRQEMNKCGAQEVFLPALQPQELWSKTGRLDVIGDVMIKFTDRRGRKVCLGPTHEEIITDLVRAQVASYKQLPFILYQIQTKFRDEVRPRFGPIRACEFIMKDAYSFDRDQAGLAQAYDSMFQAYNRIFTRCGLNFLTTEADSGVMGGNISHEFMVPSQMGEDVVLHCEKCGYTRGFKEADTDNSACPKCQGAFKKTNTIEVGHIFQLGTKYTQSLEANFLDDKGESHSIIMGCYGIGVSRLISAVIECNHDKDGIIWPKEVSPYKVVIIPTEASDGAIMSEAARIYEALTQEDIEVILDDRDERAGVKFKDADLTGIYLQVVVGRDLLKSGELELRLRKDKSNKIMAKKEAVIEQIKRLING
ncbi:MAG: proline--tRNA ligase [Candidatus Omnitrophica bacterium]|nr:proline--tRNA ligase [Candidatus Omnitrophota bacterium]MDD5654429.1 proline--tRNA ligase [Candidatus Omnitrophota bacterium]